MARLENVSVDELETVLDETPGSRETQRLMAAIIYKRGPSVPMIAEWLDIREATIYGWFDRIEDESIKQAVTDRDRSGRPSKLSEEQAEAFERAVRNPPAEAGYDQPAWTTGLARQFLQDQFDVEYTYRHVQRLLKEAGLSWQTPRPRPPTADEDERAEFWEATKKTE